MKAKPLLVNHHAPACLNFTWNGLLNSGRAKQWVYIIPFSLVNLLFRKMGRKISFFFFPFEDELDEVDKLYVLEVSKCKKYDKFFYRAATIAKVGRFILLTSLGTNKIGFPAALLK